MKKYNWIWLFQVTIGFSLFSWQCSMDKGAKSYQLPNGLQVVLKEMPNVQVATVMLYIRAGSIYETEKTHGLSRFVENSLFRMSDSYSDIRREIDSYGGKYQSRNFHDFSSYSITVGSGYLDNMLDIIFDVLKNAEFSDSLIKQVKTELMIQMEMEESNPWFKLLDTFLENNFREHPYRFSYLGRLSNIRNIKTEDIKWYYDNLYVPENISLIITGGFDKSSILSEIEKRNSSYSRMSKEEFQWQREPEHIESREIVRYHSFEKDMGLITIGWMAPSILEPATYNMDILLTALSDGESSRLNMHIRNQMNSVYMIWGNYYTPREPGYFTISAVCKADAVYEVKDRILKEIAIIRKDSITPKELEKVKMLFEASSAYRWEDTWSTAFFYGYWSIVKDFRFVETYLDNIRQVTLADVQQTAMDFLRDENYTCIIFLPKK